MRKLILLALVMISNSVLAQDYVKVLVVTDDRPTVTIYDNGNETRLKQEWKNKTVDQVLEYFINEKKYKLIQIETKSPTTNFHLQGSVFWFIKEQE